MSGVVTVWSYDLLSLSNVTQLGPSVGDTAIVGGSISTAEKAQQIGVEEASHIAGLYPTYDAALPFGGAIGNTTTKIVSCWGVQNWFASAGTSVTIIGTSNSAYNQTGTLTYSASGAVSRGQAYGQFGVQMASLGSQTLATGGYAILGNGPTSHGEIPLQNLTFSQRLNAAGQMTGSILLESSQIPPATLITATTPNKTLLCVDIDGQLVWAGIVRTRSFDTKNHTLEITANECFDYFTSRHQANDYTSYPTSSLLPEYFFWGNIARPNYGPYIGNAVIAGAQNMVNSAFATMQIADRVTTALGSNNVFAPSFPLTRRVSADQIVVGYSDAGYKAGYDFAIDGYWANGTGSVPLFVMNFDFPRRGSKTSNEVTKITLSSTGTTGTYSAYQPVIGANVKNSGGTVVATITSTNRALNQVTISASVAAGSYTSEDDPSNPVSFTTGNASGNLAPRLINDWLLDLSAAIEYTWDEDGSEQADEVVGSASSGSLNPLSYTDSASTNLGWPHMSALTSFVNTVDNSTLTYEIQGEVARRVFPIVTATVTVPLSYSGVTANAVDNGDHVRVITGSDNRFPSGLDTVMRIVGLDFSITDAGVPIVTYTLNPPLLGLPSALPQGML